MGCYAFTLDSRQCGRNYRLRIWPGPTDKPIDLSAESVEELAGKASACWDSISAQETEMIASLFLRDAEMLDIREVAHGVTIERNFHDKAVLVVRGCDRVIDLAAVLAWVGKHCPDAARAALRAAEAPRRLPVS